MLDWVFPWIAFACLTGALILLISLSIIDLRTRLLPNALVLPFALLGVAFHITTSWHYLAPLNMAFGAAMGFGILYGIRFIANRIYKQDTLGLGDVKLIAAAGLWLGPDGILMALSLGAFCGMLHGLGVALYQSAKTGQKINLNRLEIPAGPGFALGIILMGLYQYNLFSAGL